MMEIVCVHIVKFIMSSKGPNAEELSDGKREDLRRASPGFMAILKIMSSGGEVCGSEGGGGGVGAHRMISWMHELSVWQIKFECKCAGIS